MENLWEVRERLQRQYKTNIDKEEFYDLVFEAIDKQAPQLDWEPLLKQTVDIVKGWYLEPGKRRKDNSRKGARPSSLNMKKFWAIRKSLGDQHRDRFDGYFHEVLEKHIKQSGLSVDMADGVKRAEQWFLERAKEKETQTKQESPAKDAAAEGKPKDEPSQTQQANPS